MNESARKLSPEELSICEDVHSFTQSLEDLAENPTPISIDRIQAIVLDHLVNDTRHPKESFEHGIIKQFMKSYAEVGIPSESDGSVGGNPTRPLPLGTREVIPETNPVSHGNPSDHLEDTEDDVPVEVGSRPIDRDFIFYPRAFNRRISKLIADGRLKASAERVFIILLDNSLSWKVNPDTRRVSRNGSRRDYCEISPKEICDHLCLKQTSRSDISKRLKELQTLKVITIEKIPDSRESLRITVNLNWSEWGSESGESPAIPE